MPFIRFMTGVKGRVARIVMGLVLLSLGLFVIEGVAGSILAVLALVPITGGLLDFCLAGLLLGYPFSGAKAREQLAREERH